MALFPVQRETPIQEVVHIRNSGSYTIPEAARKSHRVLIDLEVISVTRNQYTNLMYNLPQGEFGNVTYWMGASINRTEKIKYPNQRLLDWVNVEGGVRQGIAIAGRTVSITLNNMAIALGLVPVEGDRQPPNVWGLLTSHLKFVLYPDTQIRITCQWYPFASYPGVDNPDADLDDPATGENEYPPVKRNPTSEPWEGNPPATPPDPNRNSRDYNEANRPPVVPEPTTYAVSATYSGGTGDCQFVGMTDTVNITVPRADGQFVFVKEGQYWQLKYDGQTAYQNWCIDVCTPTLTEVRKV